MSRKSLTALFSFVVLLSASSAFAQTTGIGSPSPSATPLSPRLSVDGIGGITFSHEPGGLYAGGVTIRASQNVQILGEFGRLTNVLPTSTSDSLNATAASFVANGNSDFIYDAKQPTNYVLGSVRILSKPNAVGVMPFVEGGAGIAHVMSNITATSGGADMSDAFLAAVTPVIPATQTKPMFTVGGGLSIRAGSRSAVDVGYRYGRILTDNVSTTTNRVYAGVRVGL
jgi:opacity protein-like surface antigen